MKVIFLDFDGVVNDIRNTTNLVVEEYVLNLKKIVELTGAKIVVSSSRKNEFIGEKDIIHEETYCYQNYEFPLLLLGLEIYDYTPYIEAPITIQKKIRNRSLSKGTP